MFWAMAAFLGGALRAQSAQDWHRVILFMVAVFISILILRIRFGASTPSIQLHGLGAQLLPRPAQSTPTHFDDPCRTWSHWHRFFIAISIGELPPNLA